MTASRFRHAQVCAVTTGVGGALVALVGGSIENRTVAIVGVVVFLAALAAVLVLGLLAWRRYG